MKNPTGFIWVILRKCLACAVITVVCFGMMPHVFINGVAAGTVGLIVGVIIIAWYDDIALVLALALSLGFGGVLCKMLGIGVFGNVISLCLAFSGGVMLYLACGEILPDKK